MKAGYIGLGAMGRGMASRLLAAGHDVVVHDVRQEAAADHVEQGASWADSPEDVAAQVDVLFTSLPTPQDFEAVALGEGGVAAGARDGLVWFDMTTNSVDVIRRVHDELVLRSITLLDAPVSGGPKGAANGRMSIWVGGDQAAFDHHHDLLSAMSDDVRYIGTIGAGSVAKLTHNMASLAINAVVAEVLTMGVKAGVEPLALWTAIRNGGAGRQRSFDNISRRFLQGKLDPPSFALRLAYKDAQLALQLARDEGVPMRLCTLTAQEMGEAMNRGWQDRDSQSFLLLQQERSGVEPFALTAEEIEMVMARRVESGYDVK